MSFDLADAMRGIKYPERTVTLYTDYAALDEFVELENRAAALGVKDTEENDAILAEQEVLKERVEASAIHINLRGLPRSVVQAIAKKIEATVKDSAERQEKTNRQTAARSVVSVTNAEGEAAELDEDSLSEFLDSLPANVWIEVMRAVGDVNFSARSYEAEVTDPNFS